jgi:hypothetical protein
MTMDAAVSEELDTHALLVVMLQALPAHLLNQIWRVRERIVYVSLCDKRPWAVHRPNAFML